MVVHGGEMAGESRQMSKDLGAGIVLRRWPAVLKGTHETSPRTPWTFAILVKRTPLGLLIRGRARWVIILGILRRGD